MIPEKVPLVGVGCIVIHDGELLLVRHQRGFWSTPGGHLDFGESPEECAARETREETGISVSTCSSLPSPTTSCRMLDKHYVTIWMRGDAGSGATEIGDTVEIKDLGWFRPDALPIPLELYFQNLLEGRCWPRTASIFQE